MHVISKEKDQPPPRPRQYYPYAIHNAFVLWMMKLLNVCMIRSEDIREVPRIIYYPPTLLPSENQHIPPFTYISNSLPHRNTSKK